MHVLFLPKWYPGPMDPQLGDFIRKQAQALALHARVSVVAALPLKGADAHDGQEVHADARFWELRCHYRSSNHPIAPLRKLLNLHRYLRTMLAGWRRVLREQGKPDTINAYIMVRPALVAWWLGRRHGIPYVISEQSSEYLDGTHAGKGHIHHTVVRFLFRRAAAVTAVSLWLGDALRGHGLCATYAVVPNVVPGLDRPLPPPGIPGHLLMVADLVDRTKNVSGVLRALALARRTDDRLRLKLIGDGPDRGMLQQLTRDLGLDAVVEFLGRLPNSAVLEHMGRAWAVVVNSHVETFSVVTGEALAQGRPVIATRCGGPTAFITPGNGILIDPGDDQALAKAMGELLQRGATMHPASIRRSLSDRYGPEAVGRTFLDVHMNLRKP